MSVMTTLLDNTRRKGLLTAGLALLAGVALLGCEQQSSQPGAISGAATAISQPANYPLSQSRAIFLSRGF